MDDRDIGKGTASQTGILKMFLSSSMYYAFLFLEVSLHTEPRDIQDRKTIKKQMLLCMNRGKAGSAEPLDINNKYAGRLHARTHNHCCPSVFTSHVQPKEIPLTFRVKSLYIV